MFLSLTKICLYFKVLIYYSIARRKYNNIILYLLVKTNLLKMC